MRRVANVIIKLTSLNTRSLAVELAVELTVELAVELTVELTVVVTTH